MIRIPATAGDDFAAAYEFHENREPGVGGYFLETLFAEIDSLEFHAGIHRIILGKHRMLSRKFPSPFSTR